MIARAAQLATLTDYLALQDDLTALLLAHAPLAQVNATQERKLLLESSLDVDSLWLTPRNGGSGCGIIVEDIRPIVGLGNTPGPVGTLLCGFVILGERNLAMTPGTGCGLHPEQIEQLVVDLLHGKLLQPYGQLKVQSGNFAEPATDWISEDSGIYARRVRLEMLNSRKQTDTCDLVNIVADNGTVTITSTCAAADLQIWFTTDRSFPANDGVINPQAQLYVAPFTAAAGTIIRAMAYAPNLNPSALKQITV